MKRLDPGLPGSGEVEATPWLENARRPLIGFAAWSGTGKTTLLKRLIPVLRARGIRLALIKHAHHSFEVDTPGKDSYELRKSGANRVLVASRERFALMVENEQPGDPKLDDLLGELRQDDVDLILVEGFRHVRFPKIEVFRPSLGRELLFPRDPSIVAVAADAALPIDCTLPLLALNDPEAIADFIIAFARLEPHLEAAR